VVRSKNYTYLLLHNLLKRGEIKRVTKGWYSQHDDPIVSVFCFKPAYIGLQEALSFHGLWEQETAVVLVTTQKARVGVRKVLESNVILRRINRKYFFGFDYLKYGDFFVPISDVEKTLIDLIYFNEIPGKDVLREIKKRMDKKKLEEYLESYPIQFKAKVHRLID
jgi:predicted transcriptional regulator of viral defense system